MNSWVQAEKNPLVRVTMQALGSSYDPSGSHSCPAVPHNSAMIGNELSYVPA